MTAPRLLSAASLILLAACDDDYVAPELPVKEAGALQVGAAESYLELPIGTPMGGFSFRCELLGNTAVVDYRDSDYAIGFGPSTGIHTLPGVKAFWFDNGQENLVVLKVDVIYSYDGLVTEITSRLEEATGLDLQGRVVLATNHSHNSFSNYTDQITYYLGGDRYNHEVFTRFAEIAEAAALEAWEGRQEAAVGLGYARDWDPNDEIYRDRRGDNDKLQIWDDLPAGRRKDPLLWMMRVDAASSGEPIAALFGFGIHGTILDADNPIVSIDAPGHLDISFQDQFDSKVVVAHFQGAGGDASPAGEDSWLAKPESVGDRAAPLLYELWESIPTSSDPVTMETRTQAVPEHRDAIHVSRGGVVDWSYAPYLDCDKDQDTGAEPLEPLELVDAIDRELQCEEDDDFEPDNEVWDANGELISPIDEFICEDGAAFCGEEMFNIAGISFEVDPYPYSTCVPIEFFMPLITNAFELDEEPTLPLDEAMTATVTAASIGPLTTLWEDGTQTSEPMLWGFFPGETCDYYHEMYRRLAADELGFDSVVAVGYAQDHEGYLMLTEDWLLGGYEPSINVWGPLQGDHILDQSLLMSRALLTDEIEPAYANELFAPWEWGPYELPVLTLDSTPDAGTLLDSPPEYLYSPLLDESDQDKGVNPDLSWQDEVPRVQGLVQIAWKGGDPGVDLPRVVLERCEGGSCTPATSRSGREIDSAGPDFTLGHTPDPLAPAEDEQVHYYLASWQAVGHVNDRAGLPEGEYRLHVYGKRATGGSSWPYQTEEYEITSESFTVVPGELDLSLSGSDLWASIPAHELGFRHIGPGGYVRGANPLPDNQATFTWTLSDGSSQSEEVSGSSAHYQSYFQVSVPADAVSVLVEDIYGNSGELQL